MEDKKVTPASESPEEAKEEVGEGGEKTFSQEQLDKVVSKRLKDEGQKWEKRLEQLQSESEEKLKRAVEEAERMAKLSAEEKEKELNEKTRADLEKRARDVRLLENKMRATTTLAELGLPTEFVELVVDLDDNAQKAKIDKVTDTWNTAIQKGIEEKLKGTPPKDFQRAPTVVKKPVYTF